MDLVHVGSLVWIHLEMDDRMNLWDCAKKEMCLMDRVYATIKFKSPL